MKRSLTMLLGLLLGGATTLVPGSARTPLQPVQHVYPDSTLAEIQQAIDNGGTVYFERLTRSTKQYGEYNQVARSFPDLPPTDTDPPKGFNLGAHGKDVNIVGVLGPNGERPKINGGTVVFRVGSWPIHGFLGLPVNFRIENLELSNPDLELPALLYSRIGIVVNLLGAQSTINNCKITISGKETDAGHAFNHSVGIWFFLPAGQPPSPPSGARIDVTNNTIIGARIHEGIHVDSFWQEAPGFTPPRAFVSNNSVHVTNLDGFPNGGGTNGATLAAAMVLAGNLSNSILTNNTIRGDGRSPGLTPNVEAVGISLLEANPAGDILDNVTVMGNDASTFQGDFQLWAASIATGATVAINSFGPASIAGVICHGDENRFVANHFSGPYPGWTGSTGGPGLFWFTNISKDNTMSATLLNLPPFGFDICSQVRDESGGANEIHGYEKCLSK